MKWIFRIWSDKLTEKGVSNANRDVVVFVFFLFLSFIFWYLNSLSKEATADIRYPVRYVNLPKDRVLIEDLPQRLNLFLRGPGYSILKLRVSGNRRPVVLDISTVNYKRVPGSRMLSYYLVTSGLIPKLTSQLRADCEITAIKPDTLFFSLDRVVSKRVPVKPDIELITDRQYFVKGELICSPDSVTMTGPKQILDTITRIRTVFKKYTGLNEPIKKNLSLLASKHFSLSERRVTVTVPVEQFTEAEVSVPVRILNIPDSIDIKIFPDAVTVRFFVAITDYKRIGDSPLEAVVDIKKVDLRLVDRIPVEVLNVPDFISSLRFSPDKVDFLIERRNR